MPSPCRAAVDLGKDCRCPSDLCRIVLCRICLLALPVLLALQFCALSVSSWAARESTLSWNEELLRGTRVMMMTMSWTIESWGAH